MITATQLYYAANGFSLDFENARGTCRICGGAAISPPPDHDSKEHIWSSWTDEALCRDPGSDVICAACLYVLKEHLNMWTGTIVLGVSQDKILRYKKYDGLLDVLDAKLSPPYLIAVRGIGSITKKHIFLRFLGIENYSNCGDVCIGYYDVWQSKSMKPDEVMPIASGAGVIYINPDKFRNDALSLAGILKPYFVKAAEATKGTTMGAPWWLIKYNSKKGLDLREFRRIMRSSPYLRLLAAVAADIVQKEVDGVGPEGKIQSGVAASVLG